MPPRQAQIRLNTKPTKMKVRERKRVSINVRNTGSEDWKRGSMNSSQSTALAAE